jgi:hypothetical protein
MVIIVKKYGQLGNRLFPFAQFIAHAKKNNYRLFNLAFEDYAANFKETEYSFFSSYPVIFNKKVLPAFFYLQIRKLISLVVEWVVGACVRIGFLSSPFHEIIPEVLTTYGSDIRQLSPLILKRKIIFVCNQFYFRDNFSLWEMRDSVLSFLAPKREFEENVFQIVSGLKKEFEITIGVHIRGGDFRTWHNGKYFFDFPSFEAAMRSASKLFPGKKIGFLLCSNEDWDLSYCQDLKITKGSGNMIEDLYALAVCDYLIGGYSSYLYWSSFYGDKPIFSMTMKNPLMEDLEISDFINLRDKSVFP